MLIGFGISSTHLGAPGVDHLRAGPARHRQRAVLRRIFHLGGGMSALSPVTSNFDDGFRFPAGVASLPLAVMQRGRSPALSGDGSKPCQAPRRHFHSAFGQAETLQDFAYRTPVVVQFNNAHRNPLSRPHGARKDIPVWGTNDRRNPKCRQ